MGVQHSAVLYPKPCCNEPCYREVEVYIFLASLPFLASYKISYSKSFLQVSIDFYSSELPHDKMNMHPAKTQISLGIRPVWSESSLCTQWVDKGPSFLYADSEDSDQTGRMPRLIRVFAGHTVILLVFVMRRLKYLYEGDSENDNIMRKTCFWKTSQ